MIRCVIVKRMIVPPIPVSWSLTPDLAVEAFRDGFTTMTLVYVPPPPMCPYPFWVSVPSLSDIHPDALTITPLVVFCYFEPNRLVKNSPTVDVEESSPSERREHVSMRSATPRVSKCQQQDCARPSSSVGFLITTLGYVFPIISMSNPAIASLFRSFVLLSPFLFNDTSSYQGFIFSPCCELLFLEQG